MELKLPERQSAGFTFSVVAPSDANTTMAAPSDFPDKKRAGLSRPISPHISRHNRPQTAYRNRRCKGRHHASIPTRSTENTTAYLVTLLRFQSHLGLDYFMSHLLHRHHGSLQRRLQEQNLGGRVAAGRRFHS
ncbi:hypothetical protein ILUMI_27333 [Ignelater luminosus]|uniref:Uncharacterized protein n=1 Tax=Ignelater luminosus TaxID=2038154 RepID=A0A8K0C859_IGNLU|nr:hypothetical protein ILUMI_27333 [Ignelater luminosus]